MLLLSSLWSLINMGSHYKLRKRIQTVPESDDDEDDLNKHPAIPLSNLIGMGVARSQLEEKEQIKNAIEESMSQPLSLHSEEFVPATQDDNIPDLMEDLIIEGEESPVRHSSPSKPSHHSPPKTRSKDVSLNNNVDKKVKDEEVIDNEDSEDDDIEQVREQVNDFVASLPGAFWVRTDAERKADKERKWLKSHYFSPSERKNIVKVNISPPSKPKISSEPVYQQFPDDWFKIRDGSRKAYCLCGVDAICCHTPNFKLIETLEGKVPKEKDYLECPECNKRVSSNKDEYYDHLEKHAARAYYRKCIDCGKTIKHEKMLAHLFQHTLDAVTGTAPMSQQSSQPIGDKLSPMKCSPIKSTSPEKVMSDLYNQYMGPSTRLTRQPIYNRDIGLVGGLVEDRFAKRRLGLTSQQVATSLTTIDHDIYVYGEEADNDNDEDFQVSGTSRKRKLTNVITSGVEEKKGRGGGKGRGGRGRGKGVAANVGGVAITELLHPKKSLVDKVDAQKCPVCQDMFPSKDIETHAYNCNGIPESETVTCSAPKHPCPFCAASFLVVEDLTSHVDREHAENLLSDEDGSHKTEKIDSSSSDNEDDVPLYEKMQRESSEK